MFSRDLQLITRVTITVDIFSIIVIIFIIIISSGRSSRLAPAIQPVRSRDEVGIHAAINFGGRRQRSTKPRLFA